MNAKRRYRRRRRAMRAAKRIAAQRLVQFMTDLARSFEPKVESGEYTFRMKSYLRGAE